MVGDVGVLGFLLVVGAAHHDAGVLQPAQGVVLVVAVLVVPEVVAPGQRHGIDLSAGAVIEDLASLHG